MVSRSALVVALLCFVVHAIASDSESAAEVNFGFSEEANADTVNLQHDGTLAVNLKSNPSTGYTWTLYSADTGMQKTGSSFKPPSKQLIGAGGIQQYFFKAAAVGTHKLQFVYTRPWEQGAAPASTATVTVNVV